MAKSNFTFVMNKADYMKLQAALDGLSGVDRAAVVQAALKSGMQTIINKGKANLEFRNKKKTGNLSKSFAVTVNKKKAYTLGGFRRSAPRKGIKGANHSYLVDRGTGLRWTRKNAFRGSANGTMYWTDAVNMEGPKAQEGLVDAIYKAIDEIIGRNN